MIQRLGYILLPCLWVKLICGLAPMVRFKLVYDGWKDIEKMTALTFSMIGKVFTGDVEFKSFRRSN